MGGDTFTRSHNMGMCTELLSMDISLWLLIASGVLCFAVYSILVKSSQYQIPGPPGLPFLGNALQLDEKTTHQQLTSWSQTFGPVFELKLPGSNVVVVSGANEIHEVLVTRGKDFAGRPTFYRSQLMFDAILNEDLGSELRWRRQVMHSFIKKIGYGKDKIEEVTIEKMKSLAAYLKDTSCSAIDPKPLVNKFIVDVIYVLLHGNDNTRQSDYDIIRQYNRNVALEGGLGGSGKYLDLWPWIRFLGNQCYKNIMKINESKDQLIEDWIERYKEEDSKDGFIKLCLETPKEVLEMYGMTDRVLKGMLWLFNVAGTTTTTSTLTTFINILIHHQEIQQKLHEEVDNIVGRNGKVSLDHRNSMPYHQATIFELLRFASTVPLALPHKAMVDSHIGAYPVKQGTQVWCNLWALHHDEQLWHEPYTFDPARFLTDNQSLVLPDHPARKHLLPFGAGQRVCIGETFALSRMFLFLAVLMQSFTVLPESLLSAQPTCDPRATEYAFIMESEEYKARFKPRK